MIKNIYEARVTAPFFAIRQVNFEGVKGQSLAQRKENVWRQHEAYIREYHRSCPLEVSNAGETRQGYQLSAYNLTAANGFHVENMFQSAKTFEHGGPYKDLLTAKPFNAQHDSRLRKSGRLICFTLFDVQYPLDPQTAYYDWIYTQALADNPDLAAFAIRFDSFTDISFHPERQINCQAEACAVYTGMVRAGINPRKSFEDFARTIWGNDACTR